MRLEDALLFVVFDADTLASDSIYEVCCGAIDVGADIVSVKSSDTTVIESAVKACRESDALYFVWDDPMPVEQLGAAGVHLSQADASIGNARGLAGVDSFVGFSTTNLQEATLAAEVGADYIVHMEGVQCPAVFAQMRDAGVSYLYAGGVATVEEARSIVGNGVFRLCITVDNENDARPEVLAEYSRLFGRVI
jgi:hypothetical protein